MSLARTCLRLAATAALRGKTSAEERVFDSRIGRIDGLKPEERKIAIAVYTEDDEGEALSSQNGGPPFRPVIELVFELSMVEAFFDEAEQITDIRCPATDAELEALLDFCEAEISVLLFENVVEPLSVLFRKSFRRVHHRSSMRFRDDKAAERMAYRYVIYKIEVSDDPVLESYDSTITGLDRLPRTFRAIAKAWPDGLPEKSVASAIANRLGEPEANKLLGMDVTINNGPTTDTQIHATWAEPEDQS
jgi:hypothetical protein